MIGSLLLLLILLAGLGRWEGLLLLAWLGSGAMVLRPAGERLAVRIACGFRRPTADQLALLKHVWAAALQRAGTPAGDVDLYVQHRDEPNAYAAGGRGVAVTSGVLAQFLARRLGEEQMTALLVHDLLTAPVTGLGSFTLSFGLAGWVGGSPGGSRVRRFWSCDCSADAFRGRGW